MQHQLITYPPGNALNDWHFLIDETERLIKAKGSISINNGDAILSAVLAGGGLTMTSSYMVGEHIKNKRLVSVLDNFVKEDIPIFAVYPSSRHLSPKVRAFVDFLIETYGTKPYWLVGS